MESEAIAAGLETTNQALRPMDNGSLRAPMLRPQLHLCLIKAQVSKAGPLTFPGQIPYSIYMRAAVGNDTHLMYVYLVRVQIIGGLSTRPTV